MRIHGTNFRKITMKKLDKTEIGCDCIGKLCVFRLGMFGRILCQIWWFHCVFSTRKYCVVVLEIVCVLCWKFYVFQLEICVCLCWRVMCVCCRIVCFVAQRNIMSLPKPKGLQRINIRCRMECFRCRNCVVQRISPRESVFVNQSSRISSTNQSSRISPRESVLRISLRESVLATQFRKPDIAKQISRNSVRCRSGSLQRTSFAADFP